ncbi:MAG: hypothetical protein HC872_09610 [Gammaproteobacteria bacterium]|nr:hypothetical protein [Gammaproteobacteria bacterium]
MIEHNLLLLLHLLLFVYWLGADLGVFYASGWVANPRLTREARAAVLRVMLWIDQVPRLCLVLMLPVGYMLGFHLGLLSAGVTTIVVAWTVGIAWLVMVIAIHHAQGTQRGERLRKFDMGFRIALILVLTADAWSSLLTAGHIQAPWMAVKVQIYALLIFFGLMIRVVTQPFVVAFGQMMREGSTPQLEQSIATGLARARPWVIAIWVGLIAAAFIGLQKPAF